MRIYSIFHISLVELYEFNIFSDCTQSILSLILVENELKYMMNQILNFKIDQEKLKYYIDWEDYSSKNHIWESIIYLKNIKKIIDQFYSRYSNCFSLIDLSHRDHSSSSKTKNHVRTWSWKREYIIMNQSRVLIQINICTITNRSRALI